jgi:hypothetical protein
MGFTSPPLRLLEASAACAAAALLLLHVSPNTSDPDLWGHVAFGLRMLETGQVERVEPFSWTAAGAPWVNHELLAEVAMAAAHKVAGGAGLLLLKVTAGILAFALALRLAMQGASPRERLAALCIGGLAAVEIGFGFACRPQIFTAVALPALLILLRLAHERNALWLLPVPPLFWLWFNTHGGALAGLALLAAAATATTATAGRTWPRLAVPAARHVTPALWAALLLSAAASLFNPWGAAMPKWLVESVLWTRPEILEWAPTPLGWDHAVFYILAAGLVAAVAASRIPVRAWELAIAALLAAAAARHVRHTPLFALAALAVLPPHACSAIQRLRPHAPALFALVDSRKALLSTAYAMLAVAALSLGFACSRGKGNPLTMEVPADKYPVDAVRFMRGNGIEGRMLPYFDWGEMCIWELPRCSVSIDGRLDTCYPMGVIDSHWRIYMGFVNGKEEQRILNEADLVLLPPMLPGAEAIARSPQWRVVFADDVAVLLARGTNGPPVEPAPSLPAEGRRERFPDNPPADLLRNHPSTLGHRR